MDRLYFGVTGVPSDARRPTSEAGVERVSELGLEAMELAWVRGVKTGQSSAERLGAVARERGIRLSAHAAYYINLNAEEEVLRTRSRERILKAARIGALCGVSSVVFHAAAYMGRSPADVYAIVRDQLQEISEVLRTEGNTVQLRPEITGKDTYFGSLDELLRLASEVESVAPCVDFAHLHARTGGAYNSYDEFTSILQSIGHRLGREALDDMHIHTGGIEYTAKGERKHRMLKESDFRYKELLKALKEFEVKGLLICESPDPTPDALLMRDTYRSL